jgi:hypothetical protein
MNLHRVVTRTMNLQRVAFPTTVTQQILHLQQEMAQIAIWKEWRIS